MSGIGVDAVTEPPASPAPRPEGTAGVGRALWRVVGSVAALGLLAVGGLSVANLVTRHTRVIHRNIDATTIRSIEITTETADVNVAGAPERADRTVDLTARLVDGLLDSTFTTTRRGDTLVVRIECQAIPVGYDACNQTLTARVPADVVVSVATENGDVGASTLAGRVDLSTDNGDVRAERITGDLTLSSSNGDLVGSRLRSPRVTATTDNGDASVSFADAPKRVKASSSNGDVDVRVPREGGPYAVSATTDNGSVDTPVATDPTSDRTVDATSDNGDVTVRN